MMTSLEAVRVLNEAVAKAGVAKDGNYGAFIPLAGLMS